MFDVDAYLAHLGYTGSREPTAENLRELHVRNMRRVPFGNSRSAAKGLAVWDNVDAHPDELYQLLVTELRGGICHEISGLFRALLLELGYQVRIISAGVRGADDAFGPDLEHMMNLVEVDGVPWLVDVGFAGPGFIEPVRVSADVQSQYGFDYQVVPDGDHLVLRRRTRDKDWHAVYRFVLRERTHAEWKAIVTGENDDPYWHWAGELIRAGTAIYGRATDNGQLLLVGRRYLVAEDGHERVRVLARTDEYESVIRHILLQDA